MSVNLNEQKKKTTVFIDDNFYADFCLESLAEVVELERTITSVPNLSEY